MTDNKDRFRFRFFEKKTKIIHQWDEEDGYGIRIQKDKVFIENGGDGWDSYYVSLEDGDLIQCTGLKDKNGKLIYEGDIVRVTDSKCFDFIKTVEAIKPFYGYNFIGSKDDLKYVEVIGNKFKNPELLKK